MYPIYRNSRCLCVYSEAGTSKDNGWNMFLMIFGSGQNIVECFHFIKDLGGNERTIDTGRVLLYFKEIYVEPMERGMLAFPMITESNRILAGRVLLGIEISQHIRIGDLEEIMAVRGWK